MPNRGLLMFLGNNRRCLFFGNAHKSNKLTGSVRYIQNCEKVWLSENRLKSGPDEPKRSDTQKISLGFCEAGPRFRISLLRGVRGPKAVKKESRDLSFRLQLRTVCTLLGKSGTFRATAKPSPHAGFPRRTVIRFWLRFVFSASKKGVTDHGEPTRRGSCGLGVLLTVAAHRSGSSE